MATEQMMRLLLRQYPPETIRNGMPGVSSIFTAELRAILLALKHVYRSKEEILILSDFLSAPQAIHNLKYDHPVFINIHELFSQLTQE